MIKIRGSGALFFLHNKANVLGILLFFLFSPNISLITVQSFDSIQALPIQPQEEEKNLSKMDVFVINEETKKQKIIKSVEKYFHKTKINKEKPPLLQKVESFARDHVKSALILGLLTCLILYLGRKLLSNQKQNTIKIDEEIKEIFNKSPEKKPGTDFKSMMLTIFDTHLNPNKCVEREGFILHSKTEFLDAIKYQMPNIDVPTFDQDMIETLFLSHDKQLELTTIIQNLIEIMKSHKKKGEEKQIEESLKNFVKSTQLDAILLYFMNQTIAMNFSHYNDLSNVPLCTIQKDCIKQIEEFSYVCKFVLDIVFLVLSHGEKMVNTHAKISSTLETIKVGICKQVEKYTAEDFQKIKNIKSIEEIFQDSQDKYDDNSIYKKIQLSIQKLLKNQIDQLKQIDINVSILPTIQMLFTFLFGNDYGQQVNQQKSNFVVVVDRLRQVIHIVTKGLENGDSSEKNTPITWQDMQKLPTWNKIDAQIKKNSSPDTEPSLQADFLVGIFQSCFLSQQELKNNNFLENLQEKGMEMYDKMSIADKNLIFKSEAKEKSVDNLIKQTRLLFFHIISAQTERRQKI